jgi:hypothetical protein
VMSKMVERGGVEECGRLSALPWPIVTSDQWWNFLM